nr:hypothetical protein Iba_chr04fCG10260 [Ipomoea batatas]
MATHFFPHNRMCTQRFSLSFVDVLCSPCGSRPANADGWGGVGISTTGRWRGFRIPKEFNSVRSCVLGEGKSDGVLEYR